MQIIKVLITVSFLACTPWGSAFSETEDTTVAEAETRVVFDTSMGEVRLALFPERAPVTVENFLRYVESGFYDATIFHRVIPGFMIQGGGFEENMQRKAARPPILNEADNGLKNERGTLSMARTREVHSATSQFFINVADNTSLDHGVRDFGYAVFARVLDGMEVIDSIAEVRTGRSGMHKDVPVDPVYIMDARVVAE